MGRIGIFAWWLAGLAITGGAVAVHSTRVAAAQNPTLLFSTAIPGGPPVRTTVDPQGYLYIAGPTSGSYPPGSFVTKLTPSRSIVYTTYLQPTRFAGEPGDCSIGITGLAADRSGAAYVTGCTSAVDLPLVNPLMSAPQGFRSSGFVAKLSSGGTLMYSTYFHAGGSFATGNAIAADNDGNAYVVGSVRGERLPLVNATHRRGVGFAAKFNPSGSTLLYSTYLEAEARAVTVDRTGSAYIAGNTTEGSGTFPAVRPIQSCPRERGDTDAVIIKLNATGSSYDYATCLGGSRSDEATGIAVDAGGSAYVIGTTSSMDFPTERPLDVAVRTGPLWKTEDAGRTWQNLPLDSYNVNILTASPPPEETWYAGTLEGWFKSATHGAQWSRIDLQRPGAPTIGVIRVATDPRAPSTLYASTSDGLFKSTDGGEHVSEIGTSLPFRGSYLRAVAVDPRDSQVIYAASQRGFWKSTDGGATWAPSNAGLPTGGLGLGPEPYVGSLAVDPIAGTLYAGIHIFERSASFITRVFKSSDGGASWTPTSLEIRERSVTALMAVRARRRASPRTGGSRERAPREGRRASVYVAVQQVFSGGPFGVLLRSDDGGATWESIGKGLPEWGPGVLEVSSSDPRTMYAASRGTLFISDDAGETFQVVPDISFEWINSLAVDPIRESTVLVGVAAQSDAFVARIRPGGGALEYSTYLGGTGTDRGSGILVDELGRAIVFGSTSSSDFPAVAPVQRHRGGTDAFVSVLDGGGSVLLFSTWLGSPGIDQIASAVRYGSGVLISGGSTDLAGMFSDPSVSGAGAFMASLDLSLRAAPPGFARAQTSTAPGKGRTHHLSGALPGWP